MSAHPARLRMFAGPSGSGKSTLKSYLPKELLGVYLNSDEIEQAIRPAPYCPWWPYVWSQQTRVRVGDDGKVPVRDQRHSIDATPRSTVIRCLRQDGDIYYLRHAPNPKAKPIVLLRVPVF